MTINVKKIYFRNMYCVKHKILWYNTVLNQCYSTSQSMLFSMWCIPMRNPHLKRLTCSWKIAIETNTKDFVNEYKYKIFFSTECCQNMQDWAGLKILALSESRKLSNLIPSEKYPRSRTPCSCVAPPLPGGICQLIWPV